MEASALSSNPVWYNSRGVGLGLAAGLALPMGTQVIILGLLRLIIKFNPAIATVVSFINNPLTVGPLYYGYYVLGCRLLGNPEFCPVPNGGPAVEVCLAPSAMPPFIDGASMVISRCAVTALLVSIIGGALGYVVAWCVQSVWRTTKE